MLSAEALEICTILLMENLQATTQGIVRPSILRLPSTLIDFYLLVYSNGGVHPSLLCLNSLWQCYCSCLYRDWSTWLPQSLLPYTVTV